MRIGAGVATLALAAALMAPSLARAADVMVGGRGSQVWIPSGHWVNGGIVPAFSTMDRRVMTHHRHFFDASRRPVFLVVDDIGAFGQPVVRGAPPLVIQVQGNVTIVQQADGDLHLVFGH